MFLFSGIAVPILEPRPLHGGAGGDSTRDVPEAVQRIVEQAPSAWGRRALSGEAALLVDREQEAFVLLENRMGCLVAHGDPVTGGDPEPVVRDFLDLARSGGRVPVIRRAGRRNLALYRSLGLHVQESASEPVLGLRGLWDDTRVLARITADAAEQGATVDVLPEAWAATALPDLLHIESTLVEDALGSAPLAILRQNGRPVAFTSLWVGAAGGEVMPGPVWRAGGLDGNAGAWLLAGIAAWARQQGYGCLLAGAFAREVRRLDHTGDLRRRLPVRWEPRYTVRPRGLGGIWAQITASLLTAA